MFFARLKGTETQDIAVRQLIALLDINQAQSIAIYHPESANANHWEPHGLWNSRGGNECAHHRQSSARL